MRTRTVLAGMAAAALLAGCSSTPQAQTSPSVSGTPSPSPTHTLTAKEKAIAKGKEAIRAFDQTIVDIYASPTPRIDDMHEVAFGEALANEMKALQQGLANGWQATKGSIEVVWVKPVKVDLKKNKMVLYACVDRTSVKAGLPNEKKTPYKREAIDYQIEKVENRWLVTRETGHNNSNKANPC